MAQNAVGAREVKRSTDSPPIIKKVEGKGRKKKIS